MGEFGSGKTKVRTTRTSPETTEVLVPEFTSSEIGVITHTRYIEGPEGPQGPPGPAGGTPEDLDLVYNGSDQLISVLKASGDLTLIYDGNGNLITVASPTVTKTLAYDGQGFLDTVTIS